MGYLQRGFAEKNGFGQQYVTGIVKNSAKGQPALQALTCSVQGDTLSEKGMRRIAALINGMGGYVDEKNIATGAYGGWTSQPRDFGLDCRHGHIAIALSSEILGSVLQESDRLYRFQVKHKPELNRMHTHIDMGGNNLNNAATLNSQRLNTDTVYAKGRIETNEVIGLTNSHVAGTRCTTTGDISRDENGGLLSCQQGVWSGAESYPVGSPIPWPSAIIPPGYLACDGHAFNKARYPKLARAYPSGILPDLRGVFLRGWDAGRGIDRGRQLLGYQEENNDFVLNSGGRLHGHHNGMDHWYRDRTQEVRPKNIAFYYIVKAE
ncbi:shufflon system plasmid conjugative transfer pilus tip adhesin PilV, partial [Arsenophonus sp. ENCA]|uniref:shufflon system plasmid conjugative transfer pilus tip adhesin PilV n=1 Tax=Arsenophonus sp. ENCA TaxID=1987579 RepID=UPI0025C4FAE2